VEKYTIKELFHYCDAQFPGCFYISPKPIPYYDLTFILEGSITYFVDGTKYVLNKNDAVFIKPGMVRERMECRKPVRYVSFNFEVFDDFNPTLPIYLPNSVSSDIKRIIQIFPYNHVLPDNFSKPKVINILNFILLELLEKKHCQSQNPYVDKIIKIIDERLTEKLSLQSISNELGLTKEYISYIFKKETGKNLINYINEQKLILAKEFVAYSGMPLVEISQTLGFDNYSYFSRLFKKHFDCTPISMRKKR